MKNKAPAAVQITAEQLLREAKERQLEVVPPVSNYNAALGTGSVHKVTIFYWRQLFHTSFEGTHCQNCAKYHFVIMKIVDGKLST